MTCPSMNSSKLHDPCSVLMAGSLFYPDAGGCERQAYNQARTLAARGMKVAVLTGTLNGPAIRRETLDGVLITRVRSSYPEAGWRIFFWLPVTMLLLLFLLPHYDVLYLYRESRYVIPFVWIARLLGKPVVVRLISSPAPEWGGGIARWRHSRLGRLMLAILRRVQGIVVTNWPAENELMTEGFSRESVHVVPSGVDTETFAPPSPAIRQERKRKLGLDNQVVAIYTGRLSVEKGVRELIDAWRQVAARRANCHLLVVGSGPLEAELRAMVAEADLSSRIAFIGHVQEVLPYYQAADLFVLPSYLEGMSNSLLEAMALGLAIVATRVGGNRDAIAHEVNGLLIPPHEVSPLADNIIRLVDDPGLMRHLGQMARARVVEKYGLDRTAGALEAILQEAIESYATKSARKGG